MRQGRAIVRRLIDRADVFLQNLAPGAAERLGFGADELRSTRPELIVVNISGFGGGGPLEQRKAYDMLIQAEAGLISITGTPDDAGQDRHPDRRHRRRACTPRRRCWPRCCAGAHR